MTWNYRVLYLTKTDDVIGFQSWFSICEVFYEDDKIVGWSENAGVVISDVLEDIPDILFKMQAALQKSVLTPSACGKRLVEYRLDTKRDTSNET